MKPRRVPTLTTDLTDDPRTADGPLQLLNSFVLAYESVHAGWRQTLSISANERLALSYLWDCGPLTMSELGERIPLSRAAITTLSDRLENLGYLRRVADTNDRRRTMLHPTPKPRDQLQHLISPLEASWTEFLAGFDESERATIERFMQRGRELLHTHSDWVRAGAPDGAPAS